MRHMSFFQTTEQIRNGTKTVTRRLRWKFLKPGDKIMAVVKCQGLKKGEKVERIRPIEIVDVSREPLYKIDNADILKEGFLALLNPDADLTQAASFRYSFIDMFCDLNKCKPTTEITRIEFKYLEDWKNETKEINISAKKRRI